MATTNLLTTAAGAATSTSFTLAAGESATISMKDAAGPVLPYGGQIIIEISDDTGSQWFNVDTLSSNKRAVVLQAAGTFRVRRVANGIAVGAFRG